MPLLTRGAIAEPEHQLEVGSMAPAYADRVLSERLQERHHQPPAEEGGRCVLALGRVSPDPNGTNTAGVKRGLVSCTIKNCDTTHPNHFTHVSPEHQYRILRNIYSDRLGMHNDKVADIVGALVAINLRDMWCYRYPWKQAESLSGSFQRLQSGIPFEPEAAKGNGARRVACENAAAREERLQFAFNESAMVRLVEHAARTARQENCFGRSEAFDETLRVGGLTIARVKKRDVPRASRLQMST